MVSAGKNLIVGMATKHQLFLGYEDFVKQFQAEPQHSNLSELSIAHKPSLALSLEEYVAQSSDRNVAMVAAYLSGAYTMAEIAAYFDVHYITVSRALRQSGH